jgi:hypothetical protein
MGKKKSEGKAERPRFKKGDRVQFEFTYGPVEGVIIEDRGTIGRGGRRLYGVQFPMSPDLMSYLELGDEDLTLLPESPTA